MKTTAVTYFPSAVRFSCDKCNKPVVKKEVAQPAEKPHVHPPGQNCSAPQKPESQEKKKKEESGIFTRTYNSVVGFFVACKDFFKALFDGFKADMKHSPKVGEEKTDAGKGDQKP